MTADQPRDPREEADRTFAVDVCERLTKANADYQQTHGHYVPTLAWLLNETRAELDEARRERDQWKEWAEARLEFRDQRDAVLEQAKAQGISLTKAEKALRGLADEAARAVTEPRRFHENEDARQQGLGKKIAIARAYFAEAEARRKEPTA